MAMDDLTVAHRHGSSGPRHHRTLAPHHDHGRGATILLSLLSIHPYTRDLLLCVRVLTCACVCVRVRVRVRACFAQVHISIGRYTSTDNAWSMVVYVQPPLHHYTSLAVCSLCRTRPWCRDVLSHVCTHALAHT